MSNIPGLKKFSEIERVPSWIVNECERWRMEQIRSGRIPTKSELEEYRRKLEAGTITHLDNPEDLYSIDPEAIVSGPFVPIGYAHSTNGCCEGRRVIITRNERLDGSMNYSAQCACGGWCTTGCDTPEEALRHYIRMSAGENIYGGMD